MNRQPAHTSPLASDSGDGDFGSITPFVRPIVRKKLSESVAGEIETMIRRGEFQIGAPLPSERDLMALFAVGRPSVREALAMLARKGLVRIRNGERARVTRPSVAHIINELSSMSRDFLKQPGGMRYFDQLRLFLESSLVRYAAEHATSEQIAKLEQALAPGATSIENDDLFRAADINFHRLIAEIPGNPIFVAVNHALTDWVVNERPRRRNVKKRNTQSHNDHVRIFERIKNRDIEGADQAITEHLNYVVNEYYEPSP